MKYFFNLDKYRECMRAQHPNDEDENTDAIYKWLWGKDDGKEVVFDTDSVYGRFAGDYDVWRIHIHREWCIEVQE